MAAIRSSTLSGLPRHPCASSCRRVGPPAGRQARNLELLLGDSRLSHLGFGRSDASAHVDFRPRSVRALPRTSISFVRRADLDPLAPQQASNLLASSQACAKACELRHLSTQSWTRTFRRVGPRVIRRVSPPILAGDSHADSDPPSVKSLPIERSCYRQAPRVDKLSLAHSARCLLLVFSLPSNSKQQGRAVARGTAHTSTIKPPHQARPINRLHQGDYCRGA